MEMTPSLSTTPTPDSPSITTSNEISVQNRIRQQYHRLIKPQHPQTNGMIERFNGRVAEVLKSTAFISARHLETTLQQYRHLYNHYIPQKNLGHVTPVDKLKEYYRVKPELFQKKPINHPGLDSYSMPS